MKTHIHTHIFAYVCMCTCSLHRTPLDTTGVIFYKGLCGKATQPSAFPGSLLQGYLVFSASPRFTSLHTHIHTPPSATQAPLVSWGCLGSYFVILLGVGYGWCHPFLPDHGHHSTPGETCRTRKPLSVSGAESNWLCMHSRGPEKEVHVCTKGFA